LLSFASTLAAATVPSKTANEQGEKQNYGRRQTPRSTGSSKPASRNT
jgi:hypothetical protein